MRKKTASKNCRLKARSFVFKIHSFYFCILSCLLLNVCLFTSQGYTQTKQDEIIEDFNILDIIESPFEIDLQKDSSVQPVILKIIDSNTIKETPVVIDVNLPKEIKSPIWQTPLNESRERQTEKSKNAIQDLIKQISSIKFTTEQMIAPKSDIKEEPNEILVVNEPVMEQLSGDTEQNLTYKPITKETVKKLQELSQDTEKVQNPFELAEILFSNKYFKEAAKYYNETLRRMDANKNVLPDDKAWVLLQIGNCLQYDQPQAAVDACNRLINECQGSQWSDLAKAKIDLIKWYTKEKPESLIESINNEL